MSMHSHNFISRALVSLSAFFLTMSCVSTDTNDKTMMLLTGDGAAKQSAQTLEPGSYEAILGFSFDDEEEMLSVRLRSTGCTKKEDIDIWQVDKDWLVVGRNRPDNCKAGVSSVVISFTYEELAIKEFGAQHFYIGNAFVSNPNFVRELPLPW